MIEPYGKETAT